MTKKILRNIISLVILMTVFFGFGFTTVNAASVPDSIKVSSIGKINYGGKYHFPVKYTSDGTLAYCTEFYDIFPMSITMSNPKKVDAGLSYIIDNGYKGTKSDYGNTAKMKQYYITQLAIYTYLGQANPGHDNAVHNAVWDLVNKAKAAKNNNNNEALNVSLSINNSNMKLTSDKKYFISEPITVKTNSNKKVNLAVSSNSNAQVIDKNGNNVSSVSNGSVVYVKMPESRINNGQKITLSMQAKGTETKTSSYVYVPNQSKYQNMIPSISYPKNEVASDLVKVSATKEQVVTEVKISKQDITTKQELSGAKLVIKDANGNDVISWTSNGVTKSVKGLKAGEYKLCETAAPSGYELYNECINFSVKADGTPSRVIMYNTPKKQVNKVEISKQDITTKQELPGATLVIKDANGKELISWVSGTTSKIISGLSQGQYKLCETAAPSGYELYTECINFTVKADGTTSKVTMYNTPKKQDVPVNETKLSIVKKDSQSKLNIAGATLVLKDEAGNVIEEWVSTTDAKTFNNLKEGKYTLMESKAPNGYVLSNETVSIDLKANNQVTNVIMYNTPKKEVTKVKISKQDITTKEELPGATLVIKDANGKEVQSWVSTNEAKYIEGMEAGKYTLCETQAPSAYMLETECKDFEVKADGSITKVIMYNTKVNNEVTKVQISKQDITTKEELPGATLVIKDANGKEVQSWVSTNEVKYIEGMEAGDYTLCETQAPDGYVLATECVTFTVKADGSITKVIMYNEKQKTEEAPKTYKAKISKQDITTKEELPGATLVIKNQAGEELYRWVSTNTPAYYELQPGTYTLTEIQAPEGYILSTETVTFTINENQTVDTNVVMYNTKAVEVPITDANISILVYLIGAIGLVFGFTKVIKNAKL